MRARAYDLVLFSVLSLTAAACGNSGSKARSGGDGTTGAAGSAGTSGTDAELTFDLNQCGVAAPLPVNPGQCVVVTAPAILGSVQHIDDGSAANGTSVVSTEMVEGHDGSGYAVQIANTDAVNWGGLLSIYFPGNGAGPGCLDASSYDGVEFWLKGSSPSGNFGVSLNTLDTVPDSSGGLCKSSGANDCKSAALQFALPADAETWMKVQVPWSAMTPGLGSQAACVPVTGQNLAQLVIQPFMAYPPPDFKLAPGPYQIAVEDLAFYADESPRTGSLTDGSATCELGRTLSWSASDILMSPISLARLCQLGVDPGRLQHALHQLCRLQRSPHCPALLHGSDARIWRLHGCATGLLLRATEEVVPGVSVGAADVFDER